MSTKIPKGGRAVGATEQLVSGQIPHPRTHTADHQGRDTFRCCYLLDDPEGGVDDPMGAGVLECGHEEHSVAAIERHVAEHGVGARYETVL